MGTFLAMSGVIGVSGASVAEALQAFAIEHKGSLQPAKLSMDDAGCLIVVEATDRVTVMYPHDFFGWDDASQDLSRRLQKPVFSLHIHDGDLWMYQLVDRGELVDRFNPRPDYWAELDDDERANWQGNADLVAKCVPGVSAAEIAKYLVFWGDEVLEAEVQTKAYSTDEFHFGEDWQLCDFMRKIGLVYPLSDAGEPMGSVFKLVCKQ